MEGLYREPQNPTKVRILLSFCLAGLEKCIVGFCCCVALPGDKKVDLKNTECFYVHDCSRERCN